MKMNLVHVRIDSDDLISAVESEEPNELALLMVGEIVIGFDSQEAYNRFAKAVADMAPGHE